MLKYSGEKVFQYFKSTKTFDVQTKQKFSKLF